MDFELSDDQAALQEAVRNLCQGRFPIESVRALADRDGVDRALWSELAEMGVFALRLPESDGGVELGFADAVLVFEELGRALVPGPLVWSHLAAGLVLGAATGEQLVGGIERDDPSGLIEHYETLETLLIVDDQGVWAADPAAVEAHRVGRLLDPLTPVHHVSGPLPQGEQVLDAAGAARLRLEGAALTAALLLGTAEASTDLGVTYAKERVQFDRPIGAFQAVKHLLADMFTRAEVARGAVYAAGVTVDDPEVGSVERAVAAAKFTAGEAGVGNGKSCIQVHGGMGYTWEVDAHLHLKRAYVLDAAFGSREHWAEVMAEVMAPAP